MNILSHLSQLNKSVIVVDENRIEDEEKERELEKKKKELEKKESEIQKNAALYAAKKSKSKRNESSQINILSSDDGTYGLVSDDSNEDFDIDPSALEESDVDFSDDIDAVEATNFITVPVSTPKRHTQSIGIKRPRANLQPKTTLAAKCPRRNVQSDCAQCQQYIEENRELEEANRLLTEQLNQLKSIASTSNTEQLPKPGKVPKAIAENHKMIELSPGMRVYIYDNHLTKAMSKKTPTATACFLLNCFYKDSDLKGKSLTGYQGKPSLDKDIVESILSFTRKRFQELSSDSPLRIAMRNKITCIEAREKKKIIV